MSEPQGDTLKTTITIRLSYGARLKALIGYPVQATVTTELDRAAVPVRWHYAVEMVSPYTPG
jgi:phage baseplate assembly protein W